MTLVPIIYASLLIFSVLLLFVIIISYISFKLKPQKQLATQQSGYIKTVNINRINNYQQDQIKQAKSYQPKSIIKETVYYSKNLDNKNNIAPVFRNTRRLEIMNINDKKLNFSNYNPVKFHEVKHSANKNFRITDENILNFYSDNSIKNYSSFSAI